MGFTYEVLLIKHLICASLQLLVPNSVPMGGKVRGKAAGGQGGGCRGECGLVSLGLQMSDEG